MSKLRQVEEKVGGTHALLGGAPLWCVFFEGARFGGLVKGTSEGNFSNFGWNLQGYVMILQVCLWGSNTWAFGCTSDFCLPESIY